MAINTPKYQTLLKLAGSGYVLKRKDMVSDPDFFTDYTPKERKEILDDLRDQRLAQKQMRKLDLQEKHKLIKEMGPDAYARMTEDQQRGLPRGRFGYPLPTNKDIAFSARNASIMGGLASAGTLAYALKNKSIPTGVLGAGIGALSVIPAVIASKANKNINAGKIYYE